MESTEALNTNSAAAVFAELLDPEPIKEEDQAEAPVEEPEVPETESDAEPSEEEANEEGAKTFTIVVDGKEVTLTESELADAYKNGLRQSDYTKKTMEAAEERKAAQAERQQAMQERQAYAQRLQETQVILQNALQEQSQINWQELLDNDPVEYLKQQRIYQDRYSALQQAQQEQAVLYQQAQQEQARNVQRYLSEQQQELLAKLPDWKDDAKAKSEKAAIRDYLKTNNFADEEIGQVQDHRHVLIARKAMLYDQMMAKAQAAAKKVQNVPTKVERPSTGTSPNLDKRGASFQRLSRTGSIEDGAAVFASIL